MEIIRNNVVRSERIKQTEKLIRQTNPISVLEIGAGDYSFDYLKKELSTIEKWNKIDFDSSADIRMDLNKETLTIPLDDSSYDLIIITEVLEHLLWPQSVLKECNRILNSTGKIIASVPNIVSLSYRIKWILGKIPSCAACGNMPYKIALTAYQTKEGNMIAGHVIDFNKENIHQLFFYCQFIDLRFYSVGLFWGKQILPSFLTPVSFSSNLLFIASKK
jgi:SAM-dependent methyltransferase